jgi:hypothetical protein
MKSRFLAGRGLALAVAVAFAGPAAAQSFGPGNLVVVRIGNGAAALTNAATPTFLDEYTPAGTLVRTITLPDTGANAFTNAGTSTSEGFITRSTDGQFLTFTGYNAPAGTAAVAGTASATTNRVVARVGFDGVPDVSTRFNAAYSGSNIRSAVTTNGTDIWASGTGTQGGTNYIQFGTTGAGTQISTAPTNTRVVTIANGQLYTSSASSPTIGINAVGTGTPTTAGQTTTLLPGFPGATAGSSHYDFVFADPNTLYVADDRTVAGGGIQKWTLSGGNWSLQYSTLAGTAGVRGLTALGVGPALTLFGTTTDGRLVSALDTGAAFTFATLAMAPTNTAFRGVELAPVPEPAFVLTVGAVGLALLRWRRSKPLAA